MLSEIIVSKISFPSFFKIKSKTAWSSITAHKMPRQRNHRWTIMRNGEIFASLRTNDHWSAHWYLTKLRCVTILEEHLVYQRSSDHCKICDSCYLNIPANQKTEYTAIFPHHLIHYNSVYSQVKCMTCDKAIVNVKPAERCQGCIRQYQRADKWRLDLGWGIPVSATWIED